MRRFFFMPAIALALAVGFVLAQQAPSGGPYKVLKTAKVGGDGSFDYVNADVAGRRLYVARRSTPPAVFVYDLDTLAPVGQVANTSAHGAVVDPKSHHGIASSKPVTMFDSNTFAVLKTIDAEGNPDGLLFDPFNARAWVLSHAAPNVTLINMSEGSIAGTIDLGAAPEQSQSDGKGTVYVDLEDKNQVAVVDAKTMTVKTKYDLPEKIATPAGLGFDAKNGILFVACRNPQTMVIMNAKDGKTITTLPIGMGVDGAGFNPSTMEAFSSQGDGTLTVIKESSPTSFAVEQTVQTKVSGKTMALDTKTGHVLIIAADFGPPPAAPPAGAAPAEGARGGGGARGAGRGAILPDSFTILMVGK